MVKKAFTSVILLLSLLSLSLAQNFTTKEVFLTKDDSLKLFGILTMPNNVKNPPVALIIADSGPTDLNGNQPGVHNNVLKLLADSLANNGIASLRYDKRGIAQSKYTGFDEYHLHFIDYVNDAIYWINYLKNLHKFSQIVIIGHGQGALIGIIAATKDSVNKLITLEGAGRPLDSILRAQFKGQPHNIVVEADNIIEKLKQGQTVKHIPSILYDVFRPSIQPFMISWMQYDPQQEIKKLNIPILVIHGTADFQLDTLNAVKLAKANPHAKLLIIKHMNHILRHVPDNHSENIATYFKPYLPLDPKAVHAIVQFIKNN